MADPKLKEAMAEIFGILNKHDIAGQVTLVSQTHAEFRMKVDPSWSCAWFEDMPSGHTALRFKLKKSEIPDKSVRQKFAEETMHILLQIRDVAGKYFLALDGSCKELEEYMDIEHNPGTDYEPHRDQ